MDPMGPTNHLPAEFWEGPSSGSPLPSLSSAFPHPAQGAAHSDLSAAMSVPPPTGLHVPTFGPSHRAEYHGAQQASRPQRSVQSRSRRSKYGNLDWNGHKSLLKKLYFDDNMSLAETMNFMQTQHSFQASTKLYKDKFKEWKWQKNLPSSHARFMTVKARKRLREERKPTIFHYGGQEYTAERAAKTLSRTKKVPLEGDDMDVETPASVAYTTPTNSVSDGISPHPASVRSSGSTSDESSNDAGSESDSDQDDPASGIQAPRTRSHGLHLRWQGLSRSELLAMSNSAKSHSRQGDRSTAESLMRKVVEGYRHILGPTHQDSTQAAYALASFYAADNRMVEADEILEKASQSHIDDLGPEHKSTLQHVLHTVELLNSWNRQEDGLAFLAQFRDIPKASSRSGLNPTSSARWPESMRNGKEADFSVSSYTGNGMSVPELTTLVAADGSQGSLDLALGLARSHIAAKDDSAERLLQAIINQSRNDPSLVIQHLKARAELLRLYVSFGRATERAEKFDESQLAFRNIWADLDWDINKFRSVEKMEACMQLAVSMLKGNFPVWATEIFKKVEEQASALFGTNDGRYVWISISVGLVYQNHYGGSWNVARDWFENACSAAMSTWSNDDGIVQSLQRALEISHFEYLTDEGRPFKTVFGVAGFKITPGRLHLD